MMRPSVVANPELLRLASLDLRHGIPGNLFYGADEPTQAWLRDEHVRQRAAYLREQGAVESERRDAAHRLLSKPAVRPSTTLRAQMLRMQSLLFEVAAVADRLAYALPNLEHDQPDADTGTAPSQELPS